MPDRFAGRNILITGAAHGIGKATAFTRCTADFIFLADVPLLALRVSNCIAILSAGAGRGRLAPGPY